MSNPYGPFASRPLATSVPKGFLYFSTDGIYLSQSTGVHWNTFGPLMKLKPPPPIANFTVVNAGPSDTLVDTPSGISVYSVTKTGEQSVLAVQPLAPATPFEIVACFQPAWCVSDYGGAGLVMRDSVTGKQVLFMSFSESGKQVLDPRRMDNPTTFNSDGTNLIAQIYPMTPMWLRVVDDLTTRHYYVSNDGDQWLEIGAGEPSGTFVTPDEIGFAAWSLNGFSKFNLISFEIK